MFNPNETERAAARAKFDANRRIRTARRMLSLCEDLMRADADYRAAGVQLAEAGKQIDAASGEIASMLARQTGAGAGASEGDND